MRIIRLLSVFVIVFVGCSEEKTQENVPPETSDKASEIVSRAIASHGGERYESSMISFTFRKRNYTARREGGIYTYTREFSDSTGNVLDKLDNQGFKRMVNGQEVSIGEEMADRYSQSVNSVWYFALLPYPLGDPAVNLAYKGKTKVEGKIYDRIQVSFDEQGGGEDYEDLFLYWFDSEDSSLDYMAYSYKTEGGGVRFRKAFNRRTIDGITFIDYHNFKPKKKSTPLIQLDSLYKAGELEKVSEIILEEVKVLPL
ncbi:DUF6503 family protein [Roseivirga sp. BDSF3-8]|uniref:DUF6503 family protein n=1 Tax=Roseivirga sp. BDSF3-8 TaxID=3241598 RepID=UPI003531B26F